MIEELVSFFYPTSNYQLGELRVDALVTETHSMQAAATAHPVERGSDISDHIQRQPAAVQIEGIVTYEPARALQALEKIFYRGKPVEIVTSLKRYQNMALESLSVTKNSTNTNTLRFSCSAKQIVMAENLTIGLPKSQLPPKPKIKSAQPKKDLGKQPTVAAKPADAQKVKSTVAYTFDTLKDGFRALRNPFGA